MKKIMLIDTQMSNYDINGYYHLACDSGAQMVIGRVRVLLDLDKDLEIHVIVPRKVKETPLEVYPDLKQFSDRLFFININLTDNALANRYDFSWNDMRDEFHLQCARPLSQFTHVFINDPMRLRAWKAFFLLNAKTRPRYVVHSHFVDVPSCPKFPEEASLWLGQCEAAIKADFNFWQCQSALDQFSEDFSKTYKQEVLDGVLLKSQPWDDGYSQDEILSGVNYDNISFDCTEFKKKTEGKIVVFVPNRVGGMGRSSDYTNCGKFLAEVPKLLHERARGSFVFIAGNPNGKISNQELFDLYGEYGFLKLKDTQFNRDEYKWIARNSHIAVGLYDADCYGGTAARELVELGVWPVWLNVNEYKRLSHASGYTVGMTETLDPKDIATAMIAVSYKHSEHDSNFLSLQRANRMSCSYESTTRNLLPYLFGDHA